VNRLEHRDGVWIVAVDTDTVRRNRDLFAVCRLDDAFGGNRDEPIGDEFGIAILERLFDDQERSAR